jgi:hypothetical protein
MFVSLHIPKTGGTTFGYILDYGTRRRILYDYNEFRGRALVDDIKFLRNYKKFLETRFDIIHGHFFYAKYAGLFPDAFFITCLREPLARTISQYFHILEEADEQHWLFADIKSGRMGLPEFAALPNIRRAQTMFLEGRNLEDYHHIGLTEKLAQSIYNFQILFNFDRYDPYMVSTGEDSVPNVNPRSARKQTGRVIDKASREKTKEILVEDYDLYARALDHFHAQSRMVDDIQHGKISPLFDYRGMLAERLARRYHRDTSVITS